MNYTIEYAIERLAKWSYDAVEIWGGCPHAYAYDLDHEHIQRMKKALKDNGMGVSAFIPAQFRYPVNLCMLDEHLMPGDGAINFIPFLKELKGINYDGYITLELGYNYTASPDEAAYEAIE